MRADSEVQRSTVPLLTRPRQFPIILDYTRNALNFTILSLIYSLPADFRSPPAGTVDVVFCHVLFNLFIILDRTERAAEHSTATLVIPT